MSPIPESAIEEIRDRADIVEVIGESVPLKKRGKNWVGLCPFHPEKTPSFNVTPDKQMYYCFGCQAGGNVFTFLMEYEKVDFPSAVRALADRTGVEIPEADAETGPDPWAPLYSANRLAAELYHRRLLESDDAAPARAYLERRGISRAAWETFLLGWAPDEWDAVLAEARRQGIEDAMVAEAGLAVRSEKTGGFYDRFRGRICFPIRSPGGRVIALSGRRLDDGEPKYLNSSDTPIFTKGRTLFNLDLARAPIRRNGSVVVVEGNFDVVGLYEAGWKNVVAPLGTAFGAEQARVLRRYAATAYLAYDGDAAGERSAFKTGDELLAAGFTVRFVRLPVGGDPDSLVREGGGEAFEERMGAARDLIDEKIAVVVDRVDLGDVPRKRRAIRRLLESVARVPDPVTRSLYLDRVASELHVAREALDLPAAPAAGRPRPAGEGRRVPAAAAPAGGGTGFPRGRFAHPVRLPETEDERYLVLHAVTDLQWLDTLIELCRPEYFDNEENAALFRRLAELRAERGDEAIDVLRTSPDPLVHRVLARAEMVMREEAGFELSDRTFHESLRRIRERAVERGKLQLDMEATGDVVADALTRRELKRRLTPGRVGPVRRDGPRGGEGGPTRDEV
ncbi:MAG TPA: DNA primase [Gemmatimonadota bacterium]|nr:DNA primase [Gemmatimonadota bacterium]